MTEREGGRRERERETRAGCGKEDAYRTRGRREKQKYNTLVMVQNRLELLELTTEQDAHLRLEDKHRHLYKLVCGYSC